MCALKYTYTYCKNQKNIIAYLIPFDFDDTTVFFLTDFCHTFGAFKDGSIGMVLMVPAVGGPVGDVLLLDEFVDDVGVDVVGLGTAQSKFW